MAPRSKQARKNKNAYKNLESKTLGDTKIITIAYQGIKESNCNGIEWHFRELEID
jgi:hypothetical protein